MSNSLALWHTRKTNKHHLMSVQRFYVQADSQRWVEVKTDTRQGCMCPFLFLQVINWITK